MRFAREEIIRCVCGWSGRGYGSDPCPRCGSTRRRLDPVPPGTCAACAFFGAVAAVRCRAHTPPNQLIVRALKIGLVR